MMYIRILLLCLLVYFKNNYNKTTFFSLSKWASVYYYSHKVPFFTIKSMKSYWSRVTWGLDRSKCLLNFCIDDMTPRKIFFNENNNRFIKGLLIKEYLQLKQKSSKKLALLLFYLTKERKKNEKFLKGNTFLYFVIKLFWY